MVFSNDSAVVINSALIESLLNDDTANNVINSKISVVILFYFYGSSDINAK